MKPSAALIALAAVLAGTAGCMSSPDAGRMDAARHGSLMRRDLVSYHVAYSDRSGPVGYMKVYDVREAGGAAYRWSYIYDRDFDEKGYVDQFGTAIQYQPYPPGAQPNPHEPIRFVTLPVDSLGRNAARMLGLDPAIDRITFPLAKEGDVR